MTINIYISKSKVNLSFDSYAYLKITKPYDLIEKELDKPEMILTRIAEELTAKIGMRTKH